jgi:hypothetical protein
MGASSSDDPAAVSFALPFSLTISTQKATDKLDDLVVFSRNGETDYRPDSGLRKMNSQKSAFRRANAGKTEKKPRDYESGCLETTPIPASKDTLHH